MNIDFIYVLFISMLPVIELRGAIPVGVALGMSVKYASVVSIIGNLIVIPILLLGIEWVFGHIKKFKMFRTTIEALESRAANKIHNYRGYRLIGLFLLVAIPLPGTGVYTGCLAARVMKMKNFNAWIATSLGVICSGLIVTLITSGVIQFGS